MTTFTALSSGFTPPSEFPVGRNARALRRLETEDWSVTEKIYCPKRVMPRHAHGYSNVSFFLAGSMDESHDGGCDVARAGSWVMKPAGVEHANRVGRNGARVLELVYTGGAPVPRLSYKWSHGGREVITFLRIYHELRRADDEAPLSISELCAELLSEDDRAGDARPAWIEAVRDRLHEAGERTPSLRRLAREFDVHPTYLARAFRRRFACSIGDYSRKLRVERVARMLARRSPAPLAAIALAAGFADQSHLTRMFKDHTGMTPAVFRALVRD